MKASAARSGSTETSTSAISRKTFSPSSVVSRVAPANSRHLAADGSSMAHQDPIQRRKLYQEVLDRLTARIVAGGFGPNDQLPSERELMESYRVGRPAVREALQHLERSGIVAITHGERAPIVVATPETL